MLPASLQKPDLRKMLDVYRGGEQCLPQATVYRGELHQVLKVEVDIRPRPVAVSSARVQLPVRRRPQVVVCMLEIGGGSVFRAQVELDALRFQVLNLLVDRQHGLSLAHVGVFLFYLSSSP